jgi:hypothetical protein
MVVAPAILGILQLGFPGSDVNQATRNLQQTLVTLVASLIIGSLWKDILSLRWLVLKSLSGLLIGAELAIVIAMLYGGLADIGMPGLFWHFNPSVQFRAAFGVTLFAFWMPYLLFMRDFDANRETVDQLYWSRFQQRWPDQIRSAALFDPDTGVPDAANQLRWYLGRFGFLILVVVSIRAPVSRTWVLSYSRSTYCLTWIELPNFDTCGVFSHQRSRSA